jgi:hypothetical protein
MIVQLIAGRQRTGEGLVGEVTWTRALWERKWSGRRGRKVDGKPPPEYPMIFLLITDLPPENMLITGEPGGRKMVAGQ